MYTLNVNYPKVDTERIKQAYREAVRASLFTHRDDRDACLREIKFLLHKRQAVLIAHYYVPDFIQELAEESGGCVADSLEMARFGRDHTAQTLIIAGVRFMGETAKILSPEKRVFMPTLAAECSLDLHCPAELFRELRHQYPEHTAVVYANTSAAVKAEADWVVTSSNAVAIVSRLHQEGQKILWASDKYLGDYIQRQTGAEMLLWPGSCVVHEQFKASALKVLKQQHPDAEVLVHPESPPEVIALADFVGSTTNLLHRAINSPAPEFIVATEPGIFYKMRQALPHKHFIEAPKEGEGATCISCARCPWMEMNGIRNLLSTLKEGNNEVLVDEALRLRALEPLQRMMHFSFALSATSTCTPQ